VGHFLGNYFSGGKLRTYREDMGAWVYPWTDHTFGAGAFTMGNSVIAEGAGGPDDVLNGQTHMDDKTCENCLKVSDHEASHISQIGGLGILYAPIHGLSQLIGGKLLGDDHANKTFILRRLEMTCRARHADGSGWL
jgi:hypothetical protein